MNWHFVALLSLTCFQLLFGIRTCSAAEFRFDDVARFAATASGKESEHRESVALSNVVDGELLISYAGRISVFEFEGSKIGPAIGQASHGVSSICWFADGKSYATCDSHNDADGRPRKDVSIRLWAKDRREPVRTLCNVKHAGPIAVTSDGRALLHWARSYDFEQIEVATGEKKTLYSQVYCVGWSPERSLAAVQCFRFEGSEGKHKIAVYDLKNGREVAAWDDEYGDMSNMAITRDGAALYVVLSQRFAELGVSARDAQVLKLDLKSGGLQKRMEARADKPLGRVRDLIFANKEQHVVVATENGVVAWEGSYGREVARTTKHPMRLASSDDGSVLVGVDEHGAGRVFRLVGR
jgi:WD40 repeat protein